MRVVKLADLIEGKQVIALNGLKGYKKFEVNKNFFVHVTLVETIGPEWWWYAPYHPTVSMELSYNQDTGELTIPSSSCGNLQIISMDEETYGTYTLKMTGAVYLFY